MTRIGYVPTGSTLLVAVAERAKPLTKLHLKKKERISWKKMAQKEVVQFSG